MDRRIRKLQALRPQLNREALGGRGENQTQPQVIAVKALAAIIGGGILLRSFQAYRRRRLDSAAPPDPLADRMWRLLGLASLTVVLDLILLLGFGLSHAVAIALFVILGLATLSVFVAVVVLASRTLP